MIVNSIQRSDLLCAVPISSIISGKGSLSQLRDGHLSQRYICRSRCRMGYGVLTGVEQESWKMIQVMVNQLGDYSST